MKRVVITGIGAISPLGDNVASFVEGITESKSAVEYMTGWDQYIGLNSLVGASAVCNDEKSIPRQSRRSMSSMSIFATKASEEAVADAGIDQEMMHSGRMGCIIGSTMGSPKSLSDTFEIMLPERDLTKLASMKFFQCVSHTAAMNVAQYLGIRGRVMATSAACASSLQAIGAGVELIRHGMQDVVLCGGAEELHPTVTGSFDILFATSTGYNDDPKKTPRPFDEKRDGLVCGEGSGIIILEEYEQAKKRGAKIYAEVIGYNTCGNGLHVSQSNCEGMVSCMNDALKDADVTAEEVDYICAHATATLHGDKEEVEAINSVFGSSVPVSSFKGYIGHTLGASGSLELIAAIDGMQKGVVYPTKNLETVADDCKGVMHVKELIKKDVNILVKNCFAFGGINAALVCKK